MPRRISPAPLPARAAPPSTPARDELSRMLEAAARGQAGRHLDAVAAALARGVDVPFGVSEPAHWMLMTAVRAGAEGREFLVSDPGGGRTAWVTEKDLVSGAFCARQFFLNKPGERPYVDCFFLPTD